MQVTYIDKDGTEKVKTFGTEDEGKAIKKELKSQGITEMKFEW